MPQFELFIPAVDPDGFNVTARIDAVNWMHALRSGLKKLGEGVDVRSVLCDIKEDGIDVTDPQSGRVFRIKELIASGSPDSPAAGGSTAEHAPVSSPSPIPVVAPAVPEAPLSSPSPATASAPAQSGAPPAILGRPPAFETRPPARAEVQVAPETEQITRRRASESPTRAIGRARTEPRGRSIEDIIADLFDDTAELHAQPSLSAAANILIDCAMRVIPSDSGSVYVADINRSDLYFAAARGPKAKEVMGFRVAMGQGLVGFSAQEGVGLAVSDAERDPRFFATISEKLGYATRSILCAPAQRESRLYGALQLINKKGNSSFTGDELNLLSYLAHQFAEYIENTGHSGL